MKKSTEVLFSEMSEYEQKKLTEKFKLIKRIDDLELLIATARRFLLKDEPKISEVVKLFSDVLEGTVYEP